MNRRDIFGPIAGVLGFASVANSNPPTPTCTPCTPGPRGPAGPKGEKGDLGECECPTTPKISVHWDGEIKVNFMGGVYRLPEFQPNDVLTASVPGPRFNDVAVYYRTLMLGTTRMPLMVYYDYNHDSGIPHVAVFKRDSEAGGWSAIIGVGHKLLHYIGNMGGAHDCLVDVDRTYNIALGKNEVYLPWTPVINFTTAGSMPNLKS